MDTDKKYKNTDGEPCSIWQMIKDEPEWVANRFSHMEERIKELEQRLERIHITARLIPAEDRVTLAKRRKIIELATGKDDNKS